MFFHGFSSYMHHCFNDTLCNFSHQAQSECLYNQKDSKTSIYTSDYSYFHIEMKPCLLILLYDSGCHIRNDKAIVISVLES